ncbi:helix-turn-helix domain-containing protein [Sandaracinobacteroides hominis]|uniref:helix-turn-helix domain-containing protein n=1 Tax=Sandaracinobacteroides hominis TaxID=2780086 RepID=UPI0018F2E073|nr:helix-turn-helix domain-containing protein [Sandaracinobacteroides hominis]
MSELITVQELAQEKRISIPTIYRLHARGEIPFVKIGRATRIRRSDVDAWAAGLPVTGKAA